MSYFWWLCLLLQWSKTVFSYTRWGSAFFHILFNASLLLRKCFVSLENTSVKKTPVQKSFGWAYLLSCVPSFAVALGLYFPRKEYLENVYIDEPAGMPLLRIHALKDSPEEVAHFHLCQNLIISRGRHENNWFQIKEKTGLLYLSKSLDREDFNMLCKYEMNQLFFLSYLFLNMFRQWDFSIGRWASNLENTHLPFKNEKPDLVKPTAVCQSRCWPGTDPVGHTGSSSRLGLLHYWNFFFLHFTAV